MTMETPQSGQSSIQPIQYGQSSIRPIQSDDISECVRVIRASFSTIAEEFGIVEEDSPLFAHFITDKNGLTIQFETEHRPMYGYYHEERIIGYYSLLIRENGECELANLSVLPEYRHNGIGRLLLDHAIEIAKSMGCNKMNIDIVEENTGLREWYEQYGFTHIGEQKLDYFPFTSGSMVRSF